MQDIGKNENKVVEVHRPVKQMFQQSEGETCYKGSRYENSETVRCVCCYTIGNATHRSSGCCDSHSWTYTLLKF